MSFGGFQGASFSSSHVFSPSELVSEGQPVLQIGVKNTKKKAPLRPWKAGGAITQTMMTQDNRARPRGSSKAMQENRCPNTSSGEPPPPLKPLDALNNIGRANACDTPLRLFGALIRHTDNKTRRTTKPLSINYFVVELGCARSTICAALADLEKRGWLHVIRRRNAADGAWLVNEYEIWSDIRPGQPWEYKNRRRKCERRKPPKVRHQDVRGVHWVGKGFTAEPREEDDFADDVAELMELAAEPVEAEAKPIKLIEPAAEPVELAETWDLVTQEREKLMEEQGRDPGHPDEPPREKRDEVSKSFVDLAERAERRGIPQMQGNPLRFVVCVMLAEWLRWRGSDRHPTYLIDRGHSLFCLPGDMARLRVWFSRKYLEQRARASPAPVHEERRRPRVIIETPFSDEDRSALEALKQVLKLPLGEAVPNPGERAAKPDPSARPGCEYPTSSGVCGAHAVEVLEVTKGVYRIACQAHQGAPWYLPNEPPSPAGDDEE